MSNYGESLLEFYQWYINYGKSENWNKPNTIIWRKDFDEV